MIENNLISEEELIAVWNYRWMEQPGHDVDEFYMNE